MPISLDINGTTFEYPEPLDGNWGQNATNWAIAVTDGMLQKAGGTFTLLADANFGPNFGLISPYFTSNTTNPAVSGTLRLANTDIIAWRNGDNTADLTLGIDGSGNLIYSGTIDLTTAVIGDLTVSNTLTVSTLNSAGVVTTDADGLFSTNTYLPEDQFPAISGDIVIAHGSNTSAFRHGAAHTLLGNPTGSSASFVDVTIGSTLTFSSTILETIAMTGDVITSANSFATTIGNNVVTNAKLRTSAGLSVIGNSTSSTFNVADITATTGNQVLVVDPTGSTLGFGAVNLNSTDAVTGNLLIANFNSGTGATADSVWHGDGTWSIPTIIGTSVTGLTATGTTQGDALQLVGNYSIQEITSSSVGSGIFFFLQ